MQLSSYTVGPFTENTYLLTKGGEGLLVDPGFYEEEEFNLFLDELEERSVKLLSVVLTHAHVDHILGLNRVLDQFDLPVYLCDRDRYLWNNFVSQARMFGFPADEIEVEPQPLPVTDQWEIGSFTFEIRYTPGHAPDHVILYSDSDDLVIAGDTLFRQGIGRYDLYKGDFKVLEESIKKQLYTLPDHTQVYPGHGPNTTIGFEKKQNPFVNG